MVLKSTTNSYKIAPKLEKNTHEMARGATPFVKACNPSALYVRVIASQVFLYGTWTTFSEPLWTLEECAEIWRTNVVSLAISKDVERAYILCL